MVAVDEAVGKFRAADRVRKQLDPELVLIARTDVLGVSRGHLDDAIRRCNAYLDAGADVAFIEGLKTVDDITRIVRDVRGLVLYSQVGESPRLSTEQLQNLGLALVIFPGAMLRPSMYAMYDYARDLRSRGGAADADFARRTQGHPIANIHEFAAFGQIRGWERDFLPAGELRKYDDSAGYQP